MDLVDAIRIVTRSWSFSTEEYQALENLDLDERAISDFAFRHVVLHLCESSGKLAGFVEDMDHGCAFDVSVIPNRIIKMLINTLRLAELHGMTGEDLAKGIQKWADSKEVK